MKSKKLKLRTNYLLLLYVTLLICGCNDENSSIVCGIDDPLTECDWLKDIKTTLEEDTNITFAEILIYRLNGVDYIYIQKSTDSAYDLPNTIFDCEGKEKYKCGGNQPVDNCTTFFKEAQKIETLWTKK
jgi:hypothetical protein